MQVEMRGVKRIWSIFKTLTLRNQRARWFRVAFGGPPEWDDRNKTIASFIPEGSSVLDLGCGAKTLKRFLGPETTYQPCDLIRSSDEVIQCDFNAGIYPSVVCRYDYVICSGVLEYIRKPKVFLEKIGGLGERLIVTYNVFPAGGSRMDRLADNWVNHFSEAELHSQFEKSGFEWKILSLRNTFEYIYLLSKKSDA